MSPQLSRRDFIRTSGALVVSFSSAATLEPMVFPSTSLMAGGQGQFGTRASHIDPRQLDSWIAVNADGTVTAYTGKCELGQGMLTAQTQLVAEELSVSLDRVHIVQCDTDVTPDQGTTSGSQSTPTNFNEENLALAAATAREALLNLASARLSTPVDRLTIANGIIAAAADSSRRATYGELIGSRKFALTLSRTAKRKPAAQWTVLGKAVPRVDMPALATGTFEFVHNVRIPGMLYGQVVRPPTVGAAVSSVDEASVRGLPGVVKVVVRKNFVGVVTEKPWQAMQAARALRVQWTAAVKLPPHEGLHDWMRQQPSRDAIVVDSGNVDQTLGGAPTVLKATYLHPYQMHASMGTSCAVADVRSDRATVWSPTQSAYPTRSGVAMLTGLPLDNVRVIFTRGAGCYGINGADTVSFDAAILSQAVGKPVRIQLTRKDEMAWENYGLAYVIDQRIGLDNNGTIVAWDYEAWLPSLGGRPGYDAPGNVITGSLVGFEPAGVAPRAATPPGGTLRNGSNAVPSYVAGCIGNSCAGAGTVKSERVRTHTIRSPFFTGPLRSPSRLQNTFAHECFLDEAAAAVKADPLAFRLKHLRDERLMEVLRAAARAANWDARPSPQSPIARTGIVKGRGLSAVAYEGDNGYVAMVAEVSIERASGRIVVNRLVVAQDCGPISNPDGMRNQIEGGALQGLSRALGEEVTWDAEKVTSIDWRTYHSLTMGFDVPSIESVLINRTDVEATGAGETAITIVAPAIGNAIFDATGVRLRQVPFTAERLRAAVSPRA